MADHGRTDDARKVVILGGGLTGISAAVHLRAPWVLFEKEARLGGHARTDERDGYKFDKTGHWLHLRDPAVKQMVGELLPGEMVPVARRARIFSHGVLTRYPYQANLHGLPPEVIKECLLGVIEAKTHPSGAAEPANFEEYCLRHFGAGISKHFMIPYNEKIWGVHPREITAAWCSRFVPLPNLEQVVAGAVGAGPPEMGYNISFLYPKSGGI
jgi:protoporphyrinogen oxidase